MGKKLTKEIFIEKAKIVHECKYDYSKVEYINNKTKVCILCPKHGEFWQTPKDHINGSGCYKCGRESSSNIRRLTTKLFVDKAMKIHGDKYDYSKVEYVDSKTKVCIIDKKYGEFWQRPNDHLAGEGSPYRKRLSTELFIIKAKSIHGNKYDYSNVKYVRNSDKIKIICPIHGEFMQEAASHLKGVGCPTCNESHLEKDIRVLLEENKIKYESFKHFPWLGKQHLDFYLPDYKVAIECQGIQHYEPVEHFGGNEYFKEICSRDNKKKSLCEENNIKIIYFTDVKDELSEYAIHNISEIKEKIINYGSN